MGALKLKLDLFRIRFVPEVGMTDHDVPFEHGCKVIGLNFRCGHADESTASPPYLYLFHTTNARVISSSGQPRSVNHKIQDTKNGLVN